jgi:hypothetical protein
VFHGTRRGTDRWAITIMGEQAYSGDVISREAVPFVDKAVTFDAAGRRQVAPTI